MLFGQCINCDDLIEVDDSASDTEYVCTKCGTVQQVREVNTFINADDCEDESVVFEPKEKGIS